MAELLDELIAPSDFQIGSAGYLPAAQMEGICGWHTASIFPDSPHRAWRLLRTSAEERTTTDPPSSGAPEVYASSMMV